MKKKYIASFLLIFFCQCLLYATSLSQLSSSEKNVINSTKRVHLSNFPGAYNPSIAKFNDNYIMTFRYLPSRLSHPWLSYIGIVLLDKNFEPISPAQLLDTRFGNKTTSSQAEDARIFCCNDRIYLIYNDNVEVTFPSSTDRRDIYIAELLHVDNQFVLTEPVKLMHDTKYNQVLWQKNWSPFDWDGIPLFSYTISPHEVINPNLKEGYCQHLCESLKPIPWNSGTIHGGTPAHLIDGEYLAFFHSCVFTSSPSSDNREMWHYFMGAYTFAAQPPFQITGISPTYLNAPGMYTYSSYEKRVIYPGGYVIEGSNLYLAYGKDDSEIWIATIELAELKKTIKPL